MASKVCTKVICKGTFVSKRSLGQENFGNKKPFFSSGKIKKKIMEKNGKNKNRGLVDIKNDSIFDLPISF